MYSNDYNDTTNGGAPNYSIEEENQTTLKIPVETYIKNEISHIKEILDKEIQYINKLFAEKFKNLENKITEIIANTQNDKNRNFALKISILSAIIGGITWPIISFILSLIK
ncbi:hypothetical protein [Marinitoga sp. 1155]|uniref:hypothetical protein n=1 Tax=Marinitoga sp. 1155 TaxID=1428448 RepID=UPI00064154B4|nr:hypothetical protein [Marinitoga sp. 1155]AMS33982.1 hypothetical protein UF09_66 [Marinitoga camini virus 2]KLO24791.1 hypothetical protein X274_02230 [Marinitoga sp. 1155]